MQHPTSPLHPTGVWPARHGRPKGQSSDHPDPSRHPTSSPAAPAHKLSRANPPCHQGSVTPALRGSRAQVQASLFTQGEGPAGRLPSSAASGRSPVRSLHARPDDLLLGTPSSEAPPSPAPHRHGSVAGLTWFALRGLLPAPGWAFLPRGFGLKPVTRNVQAGRDSQPPPAGWRGHRGRTCGCCGQRTEPRVRPAGPGPSPHGSHRAAGLSPQLCPRAAHPVRAPWAGDPFEVTQEVRGG